MSFYRLIIVGLGFAVLGFLPNIAPDSKHMLAVASIAFFGLAFVNVDKA